MPGGEAETGKRCFFRAGYLSEEVSGRDRRGPNYKPVVVGVSNGAHP